jgi:AcrR family transcriptional regulator
VSSPQLRGPKIVTAILNATLDEISDKGYPALSIDSVAQRAGVNKTTVYRHWATKTELTLAALNLAGTGLFADPDTGNVAEDFVVVARRLSTVLRTKRGRALYLVVLQNGVVSGALCPPETSRRDAHAIVERGIARGELPAGTDPELVAGALFGAVIQRALFESRRPTDEFFRRLVALVMTGATSVAAQLTPARANRRSRSR